MADLTTFALTNGGHAIIDRAALEQVFQTELTCGLSWRGRIADRPWWRARKSHTTYVVSRAGGVELRLHRVLMNALFVQLVDHRDGNGLNNAFENLRVATPAQNSQNRSPNRRSVTGLKGVSFSKSQKKFHAQIRHDRKKIHLGSFAAIEDAARAYDAKALELFGEFARLNFPENRPALAG